MDSLPLKTYKRNGEKMCLYGQTSVWQNCHNPQERKCQYGNYRCIALFICCKENSVRIMWEIPTYNLTLLRTLYWGLSVFFAGVQ